jgi:hypothetical protein
MSLQCLVTINCFKICFIPFFRACSSYKIFSVSAFFISYPVPRVSNEINVVGISIGIPIEINFDLRRNFWSKLSQVIGFSITTVRIEIPISNKKMLTYFSEKCFEISTLILKFGIEIRTPMSESEDRFRNRNQNQNSDVKSKPKSKFRFRH